MLTDGSRSCIPRIAGNNARKESLAPTTNPAMATDTGVTPVMLARLVILIAFLLVVFSLGGWWLGGAHLGWTRSHIPVEQIDPITEIAFTEWEERFVPGVDLLAGGLFTAAILGVFGGWLARRPTQPKTITTPSAVSNH